MYFLEYCKLWGWWRNLIFLHKYLLFYRFPKRRLASLKRWKTLVFSHFHVFFSLENDKNVKYLYSLMPVLLRKHIFKKIQNTFKKHTFCLLFEPSKINRKETFLWQLIFVNTKSDILVMRYKSLKNPVKTCFLYDLFHDIKHAEVCVLLRIVVFEVF